MDDLDMARMLQAIVHRGPWPVLSDGVELDPLALIQHMVSTMAESPQSLGAKVLGAAIGQLASRFDRMSNITKVGLRSTSLGQESEWNKGFETGQRTLAFEMGQVLGLGTTLEEMLGDTETETETQAA